MLLETARDRAAWVTMLGVPVLLTLIMGLAFGSSTDQSKAWIGVVDHDNTRLSRLLVEQVKKEEAFKVVNETEASARNKVSHSELAAGVVIPKGYEDSVKAGTTVKIQLLQLSGGNQAPVFMQILNGYANRFSSDSFAASSTLALLKEHGRVPEGQEDAVWQRSFDAADTSWNPAPLQVESFNVKKSNIRGEKTLPSGFTQTSMGFTVTFVMFLIVGGATSILEERQKGTLGRLMTTPTTKGSILGGKIGGIFVTGAIQATILIAVGRFLFGVNWGTAPLPLIVLMTIFILSAASLGILVSALVKTNAQAQSISPILLISMAMLGGCFWPIQITPPFMQLIAKFTITGWMIQGLTDLIVRGLGWQAIIMPGIVLIAFGAVFMTIGLTFLKFE